MNQTLMNLIYNMWQDRPNQCDNALTQSIRSNSLSEFTNCLLILTRWILKLQVNMWYLYTVLCTMGLHILFFFYQSFTKLSRHNDKHIIVQVNFILVIKLYICIFTGFSTLQSWKLKGTPDQMAQLQNYGGCAQYNN